MSDIDTSLIPDFVTEAQEHLDELESALLELENDPQNVEQLNTAFRAIHTIKGAAQFVGLERVSDLTHNAENLLDLLRERERTCNAAGVDVLIQTKDRLAQLSSELAARQVEDTAVDDLVAQILAFIEDGAEAVAVEQPAQQTTSADVEPPRAPPASVKEELEEDYDEELDEELFGIFLNQLTEELSGLVELHARLATTARPIEDLDECAHRVEKLKAAANYMGYERLVQIYTDWLEAIDSAQRLAATGERPDLAALDSYLGEIEARFPRASEVAVEPPVKPIEMPAQTAPPPPIEPPAEPHRRPLFEELSSALERSFDQIPEFVADAADTTLDDLMEPASEPPVMPAAENAPPIVEEAAEAPADETAGTIEAVTPSGEPRATVAPERTVKKSVRVDADKIDTLMNQVGELIVHRSYFYQIYSEIRSLEQRLESTGIDPHETKALRALSYRYSEAIVSLSRTANELQEGVMKVRMLPISHLFNRYPRLVHDLTRNTGKHVRLDVRGEDTELDKMIIEEVSDPLIHIIRNAVDHGIETIDERKRVGKPETGTLILEAFHESNHIVIEVSDDGRGIDLERVRARAIEKQFATPDEAERMSDRDLLRLIMQPGFSTAPTVTSTSGRGVGMDVVRRNIEKLNGSIDIDSDKGVRTRFRLKIPLTLAIISALQVRVAGNHFTIPLANVEETLRVFERDTTTIEGVEVIQLRGRTMPVFRLASLYQLESKVSDDGKFFVVVVNTGNEQVGIVVDELLGQDEVVIKPLVDYLQERSGFSGATIIGDGRISLILDVYELVKMTASRHARNQHELAERRRYQVQPGRNLVH